MNVTRNVIADLWSLTAAGEASEDSRRLVDAYMAEHADFARTIQAERGAGPELSSIELPPDHEAKTLDRTRRRLRRRSPLHIVALAFTGLTVARIVEDTTFTTSPRRVIATGVAAIICWILCAWHTRRLRDRGLLRAPAARER